MATFKIVKIPHDFICSITHEIMVHPVFTADGETYERDAIKAWLQSHDTSPNTGLALEHKNLTVNKKLKSQISEFVEKNRKEFEKELFQAAKDKGSTLEFIQLILNLGIVVDATDQNGFTALHHAVIANRKDTVELLIANGADCEKLVNYSFSFTYKLDKSELKKELINELTAFFDSTTLFNQNVKSIEHVDTNESNNNCFLTWGSFASPYPSSIIGQCFFSNSIDYTCGLMINRLNKLIEYIDGRVAYYNSYMSQTNQSLRSYYANPHYSDYKNEVERMNQRLLGIPKTIEACNKLKLAITNMIAKIQNIQKSANVQTTQFWSKLHCAHLAIIHSQNELLPILFKHIQNPHLQDTEGRNLFHWAVLAKNEGALHFLSQACKQDLDGKDSQGNTPLHLAAQYNFEPQVAVLLEHGANHKLLNLQNKTPGELGCEKFINDKLNELKDKKLEKMENLLLQLQQQVQSLSQITPSVPNAPLEQIVYTLSKNEEIAYEEEKPSAPLNQRITPQYNTPNTPEEATIDLGGPFLLYIENIDPTISEEALLNYFIKYSAFHAKIIRRGSDKQPRAYVEVDSFDNLTRAIEEMNGKKISSNTVSISVCNRNVALKMCKANAIPANARVVEGGRGGRVRRSLRGFKKN